MNIHKIERMLLAERVPAEALGKIMATLRDVAQLEDARLSLTLLATVAARQGQPFDLTSVKPAEMTAKRAAECLRAAGHVPVSVGPPGAQHVTWFPPIPDAKALELHKWAMEARFGGFTTEAATKAVLGRTDMAAKRWVGMHLRTMGVAATCDSAKRWLWKPRTLAIGSAEEAQALANFRLELPPRVSE